MARPVRARTERSAREIYGMELRRLRESAGWSLEKLAEEVHSSKSHLSRIELAEYMIPQELSPVLDELFHTGTFFQAMYRLAIDEAYPDKARRRMQLEARAVVIEEYSGLLVPGLLQTEDYARAIFVDSNPLEAPDRIEELVSGRTSRQERLRSQAPPFLAAILDEAVIRRPIGSWDVWRQQLAHLLDLVDTPTTIVQVLPFVSGVYPLMQGSLTLLTMPDGSQFAYTEGLGISGLSEDRDAVQKRRRQYERLRAYALSPSATAALLREAMEAPPA
jgi:transcriptional regulator with XRE-family HTH domain